jgi:hypothetical protein
MKNDMNTRIKELAAQAKKYALDAMIKIADKEQALKVYSETYDTKLAELIVRKCACIASNADLEDVDGGDSSVLCAAAEQIKQHFGVE